MALTLANLSTAAQQAVIDRATNAGVSSPADIRNILLAYLASTGVGGTGAKLVTVANDAAFAALTSAEVNVGDFVYIQFSAAAPYISDCILQLVTAGSEGTLVGYAVLGNASEPWLSQFLAASTAAAAAVAIVNGNPIAPSTLGVSANGAVSAPPATLTGTWYSGGSTTTTKPQLLLEPTGTTSTAWSTSGTGLGVNSASGFVGKLIDIQLGGASKMNLNYDASLTLTGTSSTVNINWPGENNTSLQQGGLVTNATGSVLWSNSNTSLAVRDVGIYRDSAGFLGQRSGTTPQGYSVYGTYTSTTNYERLKMCYNSGTSTFQIGTEKGSGGGSARALDLVTDGTVRLTLGTTGILKSQLAGGGASTIRTSSDWGIGPSHLGTGMIIGDASVVGMWFRSSSQISISDATVFGWSDGGGWSGSLNTAISKVSVGVIGVGNGTAGDYSGFVQDLYRRKGTGTPEAAVTAPVGAVFHRTDGGAGTSFYVKESGAGNTGWVAK